MKQLSKAAFERARQFCKTQARPLDRAIFEFRFEGASADRLRSELACFGNEDGGFGRALEPDLRTPTSSALATALGLDLLAEIGCSVDEPLVHGAVRYLLATFEPEKQVWRVAPYDTNAYPHAPWWHDDHDSLADTFDDFQVIPRAQVLALLHLYAALVPAGWLASLTERTVAVIEAMDARAFGGGGDTLRTALDLADNGTLATPLRERLIRKLRAVTPAVVSRDPAEWDQYCAPPLKIAPRPDCPVADLFAESLQRHLDYVVERQSAEGTWEPTWTWDDFYPEDWTKARQEWRGHLTVETLTTLRAYGRIEGYAGS
jgi:hypothetical protein